MTTNENILTAKLTETVEELKVKYAARLTAAINGNFERMTEAVVGMTAKAARVYICGDQNTWHPTPGHSGFPGVVNSLFTEDNNGEYRYSDRFVDWYVPVDADTAAAKVAKFVDTATENFATSFLAKNTKKVTGVIGDDTIKSISIRLHTDLTGRVNVELTNGSRFSMTFDIITKWSSRGTMFNQFPTRFANVRFADGSKMKNPSEAKMKREFANS